MGRMYVVPLENLSITNNANQDIFEMVGASTKAYILHGFSLTSATSTDERVRLRLVRRSTTGSGGIALVEEVTDGGNTITAATQVNALVATPGTLSAILKCWRWSQLNELLYLPTPEMRIVQPASTRLCLNLQTAVGATRIWDGWIAWEEL